MVTKKTIAIAEKLSSIQAELKVPKNSFNKFGNYHFRKAEDILESLKPYNIKYGVHFTIEERLLSTDGVIVIESKATIWDNETNDHQSAIAIVGVDLEQKGMQMSQKFGATSSYGKKYALGNLLLIDDTQDADATNTHGNNTDGSQSSKPSPSKTILNEDTFKKAVEAIDKMGDKDSQKASAEAMIAKYSMSPAQKKKFESYI